MSPILAGILASIGDVIKLTWWFWAVFILWPLFSSAWLYWRQENFKRSSEFTMMLFEMKIPREILKGPKAMEQVLMAIHALRNVPTDVRERWWDGEITRRYSFEMVSFGGEIRFFIRCYDKQRPLVEAAFFSYYPDVELVEVTDDYIGQFPSTIGETYQQGYELWGSEMVLMREEAYPIRSYVEFESPDENNQYDPISVFLEVLGRAKKEELVGIQFVATPKEPKWHEKWRDLVEKLREREGMGVKKKVGPTAKTVTDFPGSGPLPAFSVETKKDEKEKPLFASFMRTPGETDVLKAVEENLSKPAFNAIIRFIYFSPKALFYDSYARRGIVGSFNQYAALDLNSFVQNYAVGTRVRFWNWPHIFAGTRVEYRKASLLYNYRMREMPPETFIGKLVTSNIFRWNFYSRTITLNVASLATLYHPPTFLALTAPHIKRVESKKTGPPAGMAIYGEEQEIKKYQ